MRSRPRLLIVDNYDSYTYNLVHLVIACDQSDGHPPLVIKNDDPYFSAMSHLELCSLICENFDGVIISPGPGRPDNLEVQAVH